MDPGTENTIGDTLGAVSPALSAIPYVGPLLAAGGSIASGFIKKDAATQQMKRAQALRDQQVQTAPINPNFQRKLTLDEMTALAGMPGYNQAKDAIDQSTAANLRNIKESSADGQATLAAMANALATKNASLNQLSGQNAQYRAAGMNTVSGDLTTLGEQGQAMATDARADKKDLNAAATNLENAGTANKMGAIDQILSSVGALGSPKAGLFVMPDGTVKKTTNTPSNVGKIGAYAAGASSNQIDLSKLDPATQAAVLDFIRKNPQYNAGGNAGFNGGSSYTSPGDIDNASQVNTTSN